MIHVIFDQYQRYNNVTTIVNRFRTQNKCFRILEVGANEHRNLEKFLPNDQITYLDIELPEHLMNDPQYILGDATAMEFEDDEYDIVVALDVFEHIPEAKRNKFIDELQRVSKEFFVITAPFDSPKVVDSEIVANSIYKGIFGEDFIWLREHRDNGLPKLDAMKSYLTQKKDISYKIIGHGNVDIWERMMKIHFFAAYNSKLNFFRDEIDKFYNSKIFEWDYSEESYRKIVVVSKCYNVNILNEVFEEKTIPSKYDEELKIMEKDFYNLVSLLNKEVDAEQKQYLDELKIYINTGEGYNEENTIVYKLNEPVNLHSHDIDLLNHNSIYSIRIDPSNYSGIYKINNIQLVNENGEELTYSINGNFDFNLNEVYVYENDDPYIILDLEQPVNILKMSLDIYLFSKDYETVVKEFKKIFQAKKDKRKKIKNGLQLLQNNYDQLLLLQKEESDKYQQDILNYQQEILEYQEKIKQCQRQLDDYKNRANERIEQVSNEKMELLKELNSVYNSKTWKMIIILKKLMGKR
ncbi:class I SAM-dependent methyltransferase [Paenibacillus sp. Z6-24]